MKCLICGKEVSNFSHITKEHKMSKQEYYDRFLKKEGEGICRKCGKPTRFHFNDSIERVRYMLFCSKKCANSAESTKQNRVKTSMQRYGVSNPAKTLKVQSKMKQTILGNYGVENASQSSVIQDKKKRNCLKNRGVSHPHQLREVREKMEQTNLKRHGVKQAFSDPKIQERLKEISLEKYGVDNPSKSLEVKLKISESNKAVAKQALEIRKQTCLDRYGVPFWSQTAEGRKCVSEKMLKGGAALANAGIQNPSKPQVELYTIVKTMYNEAVLNYPVKEANRSIDVAIPKLKIAIEYDGSYWHQDSQKDAQRQKQLEMLGWKFIRYRDKVPSLEELQQAILTMT